MAAPEADPAFVYSVGTPLVHHPVLSYAAAYHHPLTYTLPLAGCRNVDGALVPCNGAGVVYGLPVMTPAAAAEEPAAPAEEPAVMSVEKREAEAEPEADPYVLYGYNSLVSAPAATYYSHPAAVATHVVNAPVVKSVEVKPAEVKSVVHSLPVVHTPTTLAYSTYAAYSPYSNMIYGRKKREAEAEADPYLFYNYGLAHSPLVYGSYYHHPTAYYTAYAGCRNNMGALVPCA